METGEPQKVLKRLELHQNISFSVVVFSMHSGCCCLKIIEFDLDFIAVHSNLLMYLLGFLCVCGKDEPPTSVGLLRFDKMLINNNKKQSLSYFNCTLKL